MYLHDMAMTKGHVTSLVAGGWNPASKDMIMTASKDGTVRTWRPQTAKMEFATSTVPKLQQDGVWKIKSDRGVKVSVCAATWLPDGSGWAVAAEDGSLQIVDIRSHQAAAAASAVRNAHTRGTEITGLAVSMDGNVLASRGGDDTMKIWDMRYLKSGSTPLACFDNLPNYFSNTNVIVSPDQSLFCTG